MFLHGDKAGLRITVSEGVKVEDFARLGMAIQEVVKRGLLDE